MNTLWKKELREAAVIAVLGGAILSLMLASVCQYDFSLDHLQWGERVQNLQPLMATDLQLYTMWFFPIFGAALGFLQGFSERHRDLWAFLVHRPVRRRQLFLSKVGAGLALYVVAGGLPLLGLLLWVRTPGHVAAPFDWRMTLPALADFLTGVSYYFAGMIVAVRQARWVGTRLLALGAALLVSSCTLSARQFGSVMLGLAVVTPLLAIAAAAVFEANGADDQLPPAGRVVLPVVLMPATAMLLLFGLVVLGSPWMRSGRSYSYYTMTRDGTVYNVTRRGDADTTMTNLAGQPFPSTGAKSQTPFEEFSAQVSPSTGFSVRQPQLPQAYRAVASFFSVFRSEGGVLWINDRMRGGLAGFDVMSRRLVGYLTPQGFSRSRPAPLPSLEATHHHLYGTNGLYRVDLTNRELRPVPLPGGGQSLEMVQETDAGRAGETHLLVMTRQSVRLLNDQDQPVWAVTYTEKLAEKGHLTLHWLGDRPDDYHRFALWFHPPSDLGLLGAPPEAGLINYYSARGEAQKSLTVPARRPELDQAAWLERAVGGVAPFAAMSWVSWYIIPTQENWPSLLLSSGVGGVLAALLGLALTHPFRLPIARRVGWSLFLLLVGPTGLLILWGVEDWPARETCPHCGKRRVVNRAACEHCGQAFNPPPRDGTEIFEPAGSYCSDGRIDNTAGRGIGRGGEARAREDTPSGL